MLTFLGTIFGVKWISEHQTEIIIIAVILLILIISTIIRYRRAARASRQAAIQAAQRLQQQKEQQAKAAPTVKKEATPVPAVQKPIIAPDEIDGNTVMYHYPDVVIIPEGSPDRAQPGDSLDLRISDGTVYVKDAGVMIGRMRENRLSGMVSDWTDSGDPFRAYYVKSSDNGPVIALYFYGDAVGKFLSRNPEAKKVKLTGKPDGLASYSVGMKCDVEQDFETEKYNVLCNGDIIGKLPASALSFAEDHDADPESLLVILSDVDYDADKDRDVISVYIAE